MGPKMASDERDRSKWLGLCIVAHAAAPMLLGEPAVAADEELPDLDLLAYLGSWSEGDEEWVAVVEWDGKVEGDAPTEPAPSEENDDE